MEVDWTTRTSSVLYEVVEPSLAQLYHENSKLFARTALRQAEQMSVSPFELYLASRGFRQYLNAPRVSLPEAIRSAVPTADVMTRRRSVRDLQGALTLGELGTLLRQSLGPTAVVHNAEFDVTQALRAWPSAGGLYPIDTYVVASHVEDLDSGLYHYNVIRAELELLPRDRPPEELLRDGFFWQEFVTSAAVVLLFVAVFERTVAKYGERGYRLVLLDAGHAAQNVLLTAEQLELGAVAVAGFCDDGLADDLEIDGMSEAVVHAVAIGRPDD